MTVQPITYHGRTLAACTPRRVFLSAEIETLDPDHPLRVFVLGMCLYAGEILNGHRPGPYSDHDARAHVRQTMLPTDLLTVPGTHRERSDPSGHAAYEHEPALRESAFGGCCGGRQRLRRGALCS